MIDKVQKKNEREEQLEQIAQEYLEERYNITIRQTKDYYQLHQNEIMEQFCNKLQEGAEKSGEMAKGVKYVVISILESSILTKSYDLQIAFYDQSLYLDSKAVYLYWKPEFLFSYVEEDLLFCRKKMAQKVVGIKEYEIEEIRGKYIANHYFLVFLLLKEMIFRIMNQDEKWLGNLPKDTDFLFGRYMEKLMPLYQKKGSSGGEVNE